MVFKKNVVVVSLLLSSWSVALFSMQLHYCKKHNVMIFNGNQRLSKKGVRSFVTNHYKCNQAASRRFCLRHFIPDFDPVPLTQISKVELLTDLLTAAYENNLFEVQRVVERCKLGMKQPDLIDFITLRDQGRDALFFAVMHNNIPMMEYLIETLKNSGASKAFIIKLVVTSYNHHGCDGGNLLFLAVYRNNKTMAKLLIEMLYALGASVDQVIDFVVARNKDLRNILFFAAVYDDLVLVRCIFERVFGDNKEYYPKLIDFVTNRDTSGNTFLFVAAQRNNYALVKYVMTKLLAADANNKRIAEFIIYENNNETNVFDTAIFYNPIKAVQENGMVDILISKMMTNMRQE